MLNLLERNRFSLPEIAHVKSTVYNSLGQKVSELVNTQIDSGYYGINFDVSSLSARLYFDRLETKNYSGTMEMILLCYVKLNFTGQFLLR